MKEPVDQKKRYSIKICHNCGTPLAINAEECYSCHKKVGEVDKEGKAKKPTDWKAYIISAVAWLVFFGFIYWLFVLK